MCNASEKIEKLSFHCNFNVYRNFYGVIYQVWKTRATSEIENISFHCKINIYTHF